MSNPPAKPKSSPKTAFGISLIPIGMSLSVIGFTLYKDSTVIKYVLMGLGIVFIFASVIISSLAVVENKKSTDAAAQVGAESHPQDESTAG